MEPTLDRLLTAVCPHILPGAEAAGVVDYIRKALPSPRLAAVGRQLELGLGRLEEGCREIHGRPFVELTTAEQRQLLELLAAETAPWARTFFHHLIALCLEGFLSHPHRGGNRGGAGWQAVGYPPPGLDRELEDPCRGADRGKEDRA